MNETIKTLAFLGVAVLVVVVAWATGPRAMVDETRNVVGQELYPEFTDPLAAAELKIIEFDEDTATVRPFEVAEQTVEGRTIWSIPSHENYPADAEDQLADAAAGLMGLEVLGVSTDNPGEHALYGVVDPGSKDLEVGQTGVGTRVTMKDADGETLLSLIIGKEVEDRPELRYVRRVGEDPVYVVKVETENLSTRFSDWIEKDLLKLSPWDIQRLWIRDYSVDEMQGALVQRGEMKLEYDDTGDPRWKMVQDMRFENGEWVPREMGPDKELDTSKLDDLKYALDDLKIVDVRRKPEGLSADLKATGEFAQNAEALESLASKGYYVAKLGDQVELFSNEGEIRVLMKDGVEYVLRFGEVATGTELSPAEKAEAEEKGESTGLNRYLFVTAEFNPEAIEKPELQPLPEPETGGAAEDASGDASDGAGGAASEEGAADAADAADEASDNAAADTADGDGADTADGDTDTADGDAADTADDADGEDAAADTADDADGEDAAAELEKQRERIQKENQRKQEEYEEKLEEGREAVDELNRRFGDWYYIISDEVYQKIHLSRDQIIKEKEKEEDESGTDEASGTPGGGADDASATGPAGDGPGADDDPVDEFDRMKEGGPGAEN